jgi:hypothetical protein
MHVLKSYIFPSLLMMMIISSCAFEPMVASEKKEPEILTVKSDGNMRYRDRHMPEKDVVIYEDGRGGERAAVRVFNPLHADYFRDSIIVNREELPEEEPSEVK